MCSVGIYKNRFTVFKGLFVDLLTKYSLLLQSERLSDEGKVKVMRYADLVNTMINELNGFIESLKLSDKGLVCSSTKHLEDGIRMIYSEISEDSSALEFKSYLYMVLNDLKEIESSCCNKVANNDKILLSYLSM